MAYRFKPHWKSTVFSLLLLPLLITLGFWQLHRADYKRNLENALAEQENLPAIALTDVDLSDTNLTFRPVTLTGSYEETYTFFLDNRIYQGQPGFEVFSLFKFSNATRYALVNRGWVALGQTRADLPQIETPQGDLTLKGKIAQNEKKAFVLREIPVEYTANQPIIMQSIAINDIQSHIPFALFPFIIDLEPDQQSVFQVLPKMTEFGPEKHMGYAIQWFLMALALCILYFYANLVKSDS